MTRCLVFVLLAAAAGLDVVGLIFTIMDVDRARKRLNEYLSRPTVVGVAPAWNFASANDPTVVTAGGDLSQRLEALEQWRRGLTDRLQSRDEQMRRQIIEVVDSKLAATQRTLDDRFQGLRDYVIGDPKRHYWFSLYRGPAVLVLGVLIGLLGNLLALGTP